MSAREQAREKVRWTERHSTGVTPTNKLADVASDVWEPIVLAVNVVVDNCHEDDDPREALALVKAIVDKALT